MAVQEYGEGRSLGTVLVEYARTIVAEFSRWDHTFSFVVGNEVYLHSTVGFGCIPCIKALVRDVHSWQRSCLAGMRAVPLIYASQHQPSYIQVVDTHQVTSDLGRKDMENPCCGGTTAAMYNVFSTFGPSDGQRELLDLHRPGSPGGGEHGRRP
jgi:hypothetical protein